MRDRSPTVRWVKWAQAGLHSITCLSTASPSPSLTSPQTSPLLLTPNQACGINTSDNNSSKLSSKVKSKKIQIINQYFIPVSLRLPALHSSLHFESWKFSYLKKHEEKPFTHWLIHGHRHTLHNYLVARFAGGPRKTQSKLSWMDCHDNAKWMEVL